MITLLQFIAKLEARKIDYALLRFHTRSYVEVGRFAYCFNAKGKSSGGWIHGYRLEAEHQEWQDWFALLRD